MSKTITLTATFMEVTYSNAKPRKQLSRTPTENKCVFVGKTKSECLQQAKDNYRTGVEWDHQFS